MDRGARSRTNSTSSLRSPAPPATPSHTPIAGYQPGGHPPARALLHPDQLAAGISRLRASNAASAASRSSSIPATPAPTPNPLLQVTQHVVGPEQLAAGINSLRADEGYVDSASFPATPAPSPFSPSPCQSGASAAATAAAAAAASTSPPPHLTPAQVAESIQRLCDEGGVGSASGCSSAQPPTPSTTPGLPGAAGGVLGAGGPGGVANHQLGVIPEHLAEGIAHLRTKDEGLESGSNPATPIPTPISPSPATSRVQVLPEQLAAGIHRLKVEEGMSSGGSSGFPSTPAPTPYHPNPGGVRPEELAAGISRLSVIEESDQTSTQPQAGGGPRKMEGAKKTAGSSQNPASGETPSSSSSHQPDLSQYFGGGSQAPGGGGGAAAVTAVASAASAQQDSFFDQINDPTDPSVLHSCRESRVDLSNLEEQSKAAATAAGVGGGATQQSSSAAAGKEARIDVVEQSYDDAKSLRRRQSSEKSNSFSDAGDIAPKGNKAIKGQEEPTVCTIFSGEQERGTEEANPFDTVSSQQEGTSGKDKSKAPTSASNQTADLSLDISSGGGMQGSGSTAQSSNYSTPVAPTPNVDGQQLGYSTHVVSSSSPVIGTLESGAAQLLSPVLANPVAPQQPITQPLPSSNPPRPAAPSFQTQPSVSLGPEEPLVLPDEVLSEPEDPDLQRRSQAWLPNQPTAQILQSVAASTPGTFYPDRTTLTMPGVVLREDLPDPVRSLVAHYRGPEEAERRRVLTAASVTQDQKGLRQLVRAGCYRAAVNLTGKLLHMYNQGAGQGGSLSKHTPSSLQIWFTRLALLVKLRQFSVAEVEAEPFGDLDRPDLYFQFYQEMYPKRTGSMVPFGFRLLLAELPQYLGKQHETLDRLYALLGKIKQVLSNLTAGKNEEGQLGKLTEADCRESITLWMDREKRVLYSLANSAIMQKDYELTVEILRTLLKKESEERKAKILSSLGRIFLQLGDIESAQKAFSKAYKRRGDGSEDKRDNFVDMAFLSMANSDYASALTSLRRAEELFPSDPVVVNNVALCHVYLGRLGDGLSYLERRVTAEDPAALLQETLVLNLATMYELESSYAGQKKRALLDLVSQYRGDSVNTACLKLQ